MAFHQASGNSLRPISLVFKSGSRHAAFLMGTLKASAGPRKPKIGSPYGLPPIFSLRGKAGAPA
jgi:hypothetical protein